MSAVDARQDDSVSEESAMSTSLKSDFSSQACNILAELREQGELCDAVIRVGDVVFPIHRNILSACSSFFRALFTSQVGENPTNQHEITLTHVNSDVMSVIIDYAYTRHAKVTSANVEQLLPAADQFHFMGLVKDCCDFLISELCADNCIGIRKFAQTYFCSNLEQQALKYVLVNFTSVYTNSNEFLQLDIDEVCEILQSEHLNVRTEELVFDALCRWIDYSPDRRKRHIARLLRTIRLGLLTTSFFVEKVKPHEYVKDSEQCRPIIIETLRFLYELDMDDRREVDMSNPIARPRIPHEVMFVIGGWSGGAPTNMVETYDTRADRWVVCPVADAGPRAYHGMITMGHTIYVIGGFDGVEYFNSCRTFDPVNKVWAEAPPMNCKRCYVSVALLDGHIYAMGGFDGHVRQNSVERFTKETNQWSLIRPMHHQRSDASATTLNGKVYICGGFNGQECLNSAEYYSPDTSQWTLINNMNNRRSGVGVIAYNECIYALGGFNGVTRMNTGERFCPRTRQWVDIPEMYSPRSNFATEIIDDMLFAIGGFNGVTTIFNVECYDSNADEWYDATDMSLYRSALSACVVKGLPNVQDYIYQNRLFRNPDTSTNVDPSPDSITNSG
ncbi:kelch-like protein 10 isoform X2 [Physella acuta]|uniref:kelch-like protein 10 isoform X1 n=1 Tax=Physella acuta TaxID=109671 RepID=UPI0027DDD5B8|nr:kelch-like protein 10 isoform X1 [Physella acuta]XP_059169559.1 kelch-like protein 10 isoform X2 [Physella acuta]